MPLMMRRRRRDGAGLAHALGAEVWVVDGVTVVDVSNDGRSAALGDEVVGEAGGEQVAVLVVLRALVQRLADALGEATVHLPLDDHRVDLVADVVDAHVRAHLHLAGLGVDLHGGEVGAMRVGEVLRVDRRLAREHRLDALRAGCGR